MITNRLNFRKARRLIAGVFMGAFVLTSPVEAAINFGSAESISASAYSMATAVDNQGNVHAVYATNTDTMDTSYMAYPARTITNKLYYRKKSGGSWSSPTELASYTDKMASLALFYRSFQDVGVTLDSNGNPHVTYSVDSGNSFNLDEVYYVGYRNGGWTPPYNVSNNSQPGVFSVTEKPFSLSVGSDVRLAQAGDYYLANYRQIYRSTDAGSTWNQVSAPPFNSDVTDVCGGYVSTSPSANYPYFLAEDGSFARYNRSGSGTWESKASLPVSAVGARLVCRTDPDLKIYAVSANGGAETYVYDIATNTWSKKASMNVARQRPAAISWSGKLYVAGGTAPSGGTYLNAFEEYDPATNTWSKRAYLRIKGGRIAGLASDIWRIYAIGGQEPQSEVYDVKNNLWMPLAAPNGLDGRTIGSFVGDRGTGLLIGNDPYLNKPTKLYALTSQQASDPPYLYSGSPKVAVDSNNNVHIVWRDGYSYKGVDGENSPIGGTTGSGGLIHRVLNIPSNTWSSANTLNGYRPFDLGASGAVAYLAYTDSSGVVRLQKYENQSWGTSESAISDGTGSRNTLSLALNSTGNPAVLTTCQSSNTLCFSQRSGAGTWSSPQQVGQASYVSKAGLAFDPLDNPLAVFTDSNRLLAWQQSGGSWSSAGYADGGVPNVNTNSLSVTSVASQSKVYVGYGAADGAYFISADLPKPTALMGVSPTSLSFSGTVGSLSVAQSVTISNSGNAPLTVSGITLSGSGAAQFNQTSSCSTVAAGSSCTVNVTCLPSAVGDTLATLSIATSAGSSQTVNLQCTGKAAKALSGLTLSCPATVSAGALVSCSATALFSDNTSSAVSATLTASDNSLVTISGSTISANPNVMVTTPVSINASYSQNGVTQTATAMMTVKAAASLPVNLIISGSNSVKSGESATYAATVVYADGTSKPVSNATWTVTGSGASIDANGNLTAANVKTDTTVTVTAIYTEGQTSKTATQTVNIMVGGSSACTGTGANVSGISIAGSSWKKLGDPLDVSYCLKNFNSASKFDIYVAVQLPDGTMLFLQTTGFFGTPVFVPLVANKPPAKYLENTLIPDKSGSVLSIPVLPMELPTGTYTFYAIPVLAGKDVFSGFNWIGNLAKYEVTLSK